MRTLYKVKPFENYYTFVRPLETTEVSDLRKYPVKMLNFVPKASDKDSYVSMNLVIVRAYKIGDDFYVE